MTHTLSTRLQQCNNDNSERYLVGDLSQTHDRSLLLYIGTHPLENDTLHPTIAQHLARHVDYKNWCAIHLYPVRSQCSNTMDTSLNTQAHQRNLNTLKQFFTQHYGHTIDVWAAWGQDIKSREYLNRCLDEISNLIPSHARWYSLDTLTNHAYSTAPPLLGDSLELCEFDINDYLENSLPNKTYL